MVLARARWACQACGARTGLDVHHVLKRSQGGSDFDVDGLVTLCRPCHEQTDAPYSSGRLMVTPLGAGRFACEVIRRRSKDDQSARSRRRGASIDQPVLKDVARLPVRANTRADRAGLRPNAGLSAQAMFDEGDRVMGGEPGRGGGMTAVHWEQEELIVECGPGVSAETARRAVAQLVASGRNPPLEVRDHRAEVALSALIGRLWLGAEWCEGRPYVVVIIGSRGLVALPSGGSSG